MSEESSQEVQSKTNEIWFRGLYMLLFLAILGLVKGVVFVVAVIQFILVAVNKTANMPLRNFGQGLSTYLYHITQFLIFNTDNKPFPFEDWSSEPPRSVDEVTNLGADSG
ncbi:MAG: DUF4389 domain-containing protein [Gammaproteobacteria bacterium]|nr:DUF4389 domain-containing protein [Gammaproteobacteria bacterium]